MADNPSRQLSGDENVAEEDEIEDESGQPLFWRKFNLSRAKLRGVTEMAALMAGFSVVATVELDISKATSEPLLISFALTTALLVSTTMLAIMIATCILPYVDTVMKVNSIGYAKKLPHESLIFYIDLSWFLANSVSICLFIIDVIFLSWIKFPQVPALCITGILIPVLGLMCAFSVLFYRQTVQHQYRIYDKKYNELKMLSMKLNRLNNISRSNSSHAVHNV